MDTNRSPTNPAPAVFTGQAGEYFRIWIVNMALTILTLGIYSAWATVRKRRYFYTHTSLAGGSFDFHADPKAILFGRVIAVALLALYLGSGYIHPFAPPLVVLLVLALVPWLVVRSRIFRLRNTSYRGIRFNFLPNYKEAFKAYYGGALLTVVTLGLGAATAVYWRNRFAVRNSAFGKTPFTFGGQHGEFVAIFWKSIGLIALVVFGWLTLSFVLPIIGPSMPDGEEGGGSQILGFITVIPLFLLYAAIGVYYQVCLQNHVWNTTGLGENSFQSILQVGDMIFIYLTNLLAIVGSVGMLTPWAQIRLARYRARHMYVQLSENWQEFLADTRPVGSALGDEIGEAFDVDVSLGF
ncbi:MAG: YjgN family protein [Woeseiaceae bacterium]